VGGCIRALVERLAKRDGVDLGSTVEQGILLGSGFIAGEGLMGVGIALYAFITGKRPEGFGFAFEGHWGELVAVAAFAALGYLLFSSRTRRSAA
jgi:hypothetical protein